MEKLGTVVNRIVGGLSVEGEHAKPAERAADRGFVVVSLRDYRIEMDGSRRKIALPSSRTFGLQRPMVR